MKTLGVPVKISFAFAGKNFIAKDIDILREARARDGRNNKKDPLLKSQPFLKQKRADFIKMIKAG